MSNLMHFEYRFLSDGAVAQELAENHLYVDVGSIRHPRVFDHRLGGDEQEKVPAAMIWDGRENLSALVDQQDTAIIHTHQHPCWNGCWGVFLLTSLLSGTPVAESKVEEMNTFSSFLLTGFNPTDGSLERSVIAVFESLMADIEEREKDPAKRDQQKLVTGMDFIAHCLEKMTSYEDLKTGLFLAETGPYGRNLLTVREDYHVYLRDLHQGRRFTAEVSRRSGERQRVDGLWLRKPHSRLFKFWARADREHSYGKAGFPLTWVQWASDRWIISVDPASGFLLIGLGDRLSDMENRRNPLRPEVSNREGYDCPNPWYDARNTLNAHTIVDCPRGGTVLPEKLVLKELRAFCKVRLWRPAFQKPSWWRDMFVPRVVPIFSLSAALMVAIWVYQLQAGGERCRKWENLADINIAEGRHVALVIGINDYSTSPGWENLQAPVADAEAVMKILLKGYGFAPLAGEGPISKLLVSGKSGSLNEQTLTEAIRKMAENLTDKDSLLIYFAGHGSMNSTFGYWIPTEAKNESDYISNSTIAEILKASPARHILVLSDSCYAGALNGEREGQQRQDVLGGKKERSFPVGESYNRPSRQLLSAGDYEPVPDLGRGRIHSPFADCFSKSLRRPRAADITAKDLFSEIGLCLEGKWQKQKPQLNPVADTCDDQGQFLFRKQF